jgi:hypothetical protein
MNEQLAMRIQAYLDGELSKKASDHLFAEIRNDSEAEVLFNELQAEHKLLSDLEEPEISLPVAHIYFWQGIAKGIEPEIKRNIPEHKLIKLFFRPRWLSWLIPVGAACLVVLAVQQVFFGVRLPLVQNPSPRHAPSFHEVDSRQQHAGFISFRSESEGVSVVWISNY